MIQWKAIAKGDVNQHHALNDPERRANHAFGPHANRMTLARESSKEFGFWCAIWLWRSRFLLIQSKSEGFLGPNAFAIKPF